MDRYSGPLDVGIPTDTETRLNIIYFFKASKTHNFSFSMTFVAALAVAVAAVVFWAVTSMAWISIERQESERLRTELKTTKSKLFEYQSRYDDVFGKVYGPESEVSPKTEPLIDPLDSEQVQDVETGSNDKKAKESKEAALEAEIPKVVENSPETELAKRAADSFALNSSEPIDLTLARNDSSSSEKVLLRYMQKNSSDLVIDLKNISLEKTNSGYQLQFNMINPTGVLQGGVVKLAAYFDEKPDQPWNIRESRYVGIYKGIIGGKGLSYSLKNLNSKAIYIKSPNKKSRLTKAVVQLVSRPCSKFWSETCDDKKNLKTFELRAAGSQKLAVGKRTQFERVANF